MGLTYEERQALRARAAGLRDEVSSLRSEQDQAVSSLSQDIEDAALLQEVQLLEKQRDDAAASRDRATVTADQAAALMREIAKTELVTEAVAVTRTDDFVASDSASETNFDETPSAKESALNAPLATEESE